jgi:hypothetical protein
MKTSFIWTTCKVTKQYLSSKFACQIVDFCKISHEEGQTKEQGHLKS